MSAIQRVRVKGKTYVLTEPGDVVATAPRAGWVRLPSGTDVPIWRAKFAIADGAANTVIVAAQDGFVLRPVALRYLTAAAAATLVLNSKASGAATAISEVFTPGANGGMVIPRNDDGVTLDTNLGEGITGTNGGGAAIVGFIHYLKIPASEFSLDEAGAIIGWNNGAPYIG